MRPHPARRSPAWPASALVGLLTTGSCGDESSFPTTSTTFELVYVVGSESSDQCPSSVAELVVSLRDPAGVEERPGYPRRHPCSAIRLEEPLGPAVLEVRAVGPLDEDPEVTLFAARASVELAGGRARLELRPEVAFVTLDWNFGDRALAPCTTEVSQIELTIQAVGAASGVRRTLPCTGGPVVLERPFRLAPHVIEVRGVSSGGYPLYAHATQRLLDRGPNAYVAVLAPLGGQILLDWRFGLRGAPIANCDDPRVEVERVEVEVRGVVASGDGWTSDGSPVLRERLTCSAARPAALGAARFRAGRWLEVELEAEGVHRFRALERFEMPEGDVVRDLSTLEAVGTVTATIAVATTTCVSGGDDVYWLEARTPSGGLAGRVELTEPGRVELADLPYGAYLVQVGRWPPSSRCPPSAPSERAVGARAEGWGTFGL